jgi:hypothetical protein
MNIFLPTDCSKDSVRAACSLYGAWRMTSFGDGGATFSRPEDINSNGGAADAPDSAIIPMAVGQRYCEQWAAQSAVLSDRAGRTGLQLIPSVSFARTCTSALTHSFGF